MFFSHIFFFFNDTATTEIYTLSYTTLFRSHVICGEEKRRAPVIRIASAGSKHTIDRKSTRLNSSHTVISYAVFCLKKKKTMNTRCRGHDTYTATSFINATVYRQITLPRH